MLENQKSNLFRGKGEKDLECDTKNYFIKHIKNILISASIFQI